MMTKKTLGILAILALACTMSFGCSDSGDDSGTGGGGGGTGTGGGGDTGTGGGGGDTTSGNFKAECEKACDRKAASDCQKKQDAAKCKKFCEFLDIGLSTNTDCSGAFSSSQACINTKDIKCDENGKPVVEGCNTEGKAATDCVAKYDSEYGCEAACKKLVPSERCSEKDFKNEQECKEKCTESGRVTRMISTCLTQYKEMRTCDANHEAACISVDGKNMYAASACVEKYWAWAMCINDIIKEIKE